MPTNTESLVVAVLALVPGYLLIRFGSRQSFRAHPDSATEWVLNSLASSLVIQIVAFPVTLTTIYPVRDQIFNHPYRLIIWLVVVVLVIPLALGRLIAFLRPWMTDAWAQRRWWARQLSTLLISDIADAWDWLDDHNQSDDSEGCFASTLRRWITDWWANRPSWARQQSPRDSAVAGAVNLPDEHPAAPPTNEPLFERPRLADKIWILELEGGEVLAGSGSEVVGLGKGRAIWLQELWTVSGDAGLAGPIPGKPGALIPSSANKAVRFQTQPANR